MSSHLPAAGSAPSQEAVERLERQAARERRARLEAEAIAERSLRHLYGQQEQLRLLQALAAAANAAADTDEAMHAALRLVCEHAGWCVGHVYRRRGERLVPTAIWHTRGTDDRFAGWRTATEATTFEHGEGLPGRILASGRPAWIRDVAEDANFPHAEVAVEHGLRGAMAFPVLVGAEIAAVLAFFSDRPEEPDAALLDLMAYAGIQLGYVVERQRLQRWHALLLSAAGEGLYGLDTDGRITFVNPAAAEMVGWAPEALIGKSPNDVLHPFPADGLPYPVEDGPIPRTLRDGRARRVTGEVFQHRDGTRFPVEYVATPLREGDEVTGAVVAFHDVSERVRSEEALRQSEAQLRNAQAIAHIGSWRWDVGADRVVWSDELFRIFGRTPGSVEVDFETYTGFLHPDDREALLRAVEEAVAQGRPYEAEHRIVWPDGTVRWVHSHGEPVLGDAGVVALQGTAQDVTERVAHEHARQRYAAELEESNEELVKFAYVASHDLQEPLRMVTSFLQLLERRYEGQLDDTARQYIGHAVDGARRMQRLIQDLLAYSRIGTRGREFQPVDSREVVLDVLHDLGPAIAEAGAEVEAADLPVVFADPTQLHQLFLNLVGNALKFRRDGVTPRIELRAEPAPLEDGRAGWRYTVSDNGIGLDEQYADRIFQVFQRLHTRKEYEGTGIGLAICRKIVERHGGTVSVRSVLGEGATFTFTLPAPLGAAAPPSPS